MNVDNVKKSKISRRGFIRCSLSAAAGLGIIGRERLLGANAGTPKGELKIREYRTLGRTGFEVSDIGLGAGFLTNAAVLEAALDAGINYIDTAEHYVGGNSERTIGQIIKGRDRKKIFITTKLNFMMGGASKEKLKIRALKCLERLQIDYVDCLMIHMTPNVEQVKLENYHETIRELKAEGKVRFTGLSNHGIEHRMSGPVKDPMDKVILAAAEDGRFDVVLFVYNFIQREKGEKILEACKEKNMGTTLMKTNPVKSYLEIEERLTVTRKRGRKIPDAVMKIVDEYKSRANQAKEFAKKYGLIGDDQVSGAAIKFCLNNPDVHSVCPSINTFDDLEASLALSGTRLEPVEKDMLTDYESVFGQFYCRHACGQCESSCPQTVPVNTIMRYQHYFEAQGREKYATEEYGALPGNSASVCPDCVGHCEVACPYNVPIQGLLMLAHQTLTL